MAYAEKPRLAAGWNRMQQRSNKLPLAALCVLLLATSSASGQPVLSKAILLEPMRTGAFASMSTCPTIPHDTVCTDTQFSAGLQKEDGTAQFGLFQVTYRLDEFAFVLISAVWGQGPATVSVTPSLTALTASGVMDLTLCNSNFECAPAVSTPVTGVWTATSPVLHDGPSISLGSTNLVVSGLDIYRFARAEVVTGGVQVLGESSAIGTRIMRAQRLTVCLTFFPHGCVYP